MQASPHSTIQLLRFHFSLFLLPIYLFALSQLPTVDWANATLIFFILHLLVYPSSNGYNSYMDRDSTPIGGLKTPLPPTRQLYVVTIWMDVVAIILSLIIGITFTMGIILYILASRAYSYRGIRLKKHPVIGYLTVVIFQGALVFYLVYFGSHQGQQLIVPLIGMIISSLLIGGVYPLTQIYQHQADLQDGVITLSYQLGYRGTFLFTGIVYAVAFGLLAWHFSSMYDLTGFLILQVLMLPVIIYFVFWMNKVFRDENQANFKNTMRMNLLASLCTTLAFSILLIRNYFE